MHHRLRVLTTLLLVTAGCTAKEAGIPGPTAPAGVGASGVSILVSVNPNIVNLGTASASGQSATVVVQALDASGTPASGKTVRLDVLVNGSTEDCGQFTQRTLTTSSDGRASTLFTAPGFPLPQPQCANFSPGSAVTIVATPVGATTVTASSSASLQMVQPGTSVSATDLPTAQFIISPTSPTVGTQVQFDASTSCAGPLTGASCTSTSTITSYAWTFGDGTTKTGQTTTHDFDASNTFNVTLTVTNSRGFTASTTKSLTIGGAASPTVDFVSSPTTPKVNDTIFFDASASKAAAGRSIASYSWTFGDGSSATGASPTKQSSASGTFVVILTVTDDIGQKTVASKSVTVAALSLSAPTASFTFSPTAPASGQTVFFNGSASSASTSHTISSYAWDFGDGSPAGTSATPTHIFASAGSYVVTLTVTDDAALTGITTRTVTVSSVSGTAPPTASFTFSPSAPALGDTVFFSAVNSTAAAGHSISSYTWTFGDNTGPTIGGPTTTHAYPPASGAGVYTVVLIVTDDIGQTATTSQSVTVGNPPAPTALFVSTIQPGTLTVLFDASTSTAAQGQTITHYYWVFGDGNEHDNGTDKTRLHTYAAAGVYSVTLTVTDSAGRTNTTSGTVTFP